MHKDFQLEVQPFNSIKMNIQILIKANSWRQGKADSLLNRGERRVANLLNIAGDLGCKLNLERKFYHFVFVFVNCSILGNTTSLKDCNGATFCSPSKRTGMSSYLVDGEMVRKKDLTERALWKFLKIGILLWKVDAAGDLLLKQFGFLLWPRMNLQGIQ